MQKNDDQSSGASLGTPVTMVTDADVITPPGPSSPPPEVPPLMTEGDTSLMTEGDTSLLTEGDTSLLTEEQTTGDGGTLVVPSPVRAKSAPIPPTNKLAVGELPDSRRRSSDVSFRGSECRSAEDMMMGTSQCEGDLNDYFSTMDPSQLHFYDFGIQDFLGKKSRQYVDMSHEAEEVQHGDASRGMNVSPRSYLSDSEISVTSMDNFRSPAQVLWEKKLRDEASVLRNCLLKRGRKQAVAALEAGSGKMRGLSRRATELCFGHQRAKNFVRKLLARPLSVTELGITDDNSLISSQKSSLDLGDDCTTIARPPLDIDDDCENLHLSSLNISDNRNVDSGLDNGNGDTREESEAELTS